MLDTKESNTRSEESQEFTSENSASPVNYDGAINPEKSSKPKEVHDDTIYDNMIFPS